MDDARPGVEDPKVIVDFGDCRHGRTRVLGRGLLLDGHGRRDSLNGLGVGLFHAFEKLAGVGRQGFEKAALPFGVECVEGQGGFARAAHACDDDELEKRDVQVDGLQIVDADAPQGDRFFRCHGKSRKAIIPDLFIRMLHAIMAGRARK